MSSSERDFCNHSAVYCTGHSRASTRAEEKMRLDAGTHLSTCLDRAVRASTRAMLTLAGAYAILAPDRSAVWALPCTCRWSVRYMKRFRAE